MKLAIFLACAWTLGISATATAAEDKALDRASRSITVNFWEEPKTMDPQVAADTIGIMLLSHSNEGLTRLDPRNQAAPAVAESWTMEGKTKYTFKIRKGAQWSDGKQITAHDFVFAWRRAVDPKTASEYAFIMNPVKNASAINEGKKPIDTLGVTAKDDLTVEVQLERPTGYFLRLVSFPTYFPGREDLAKKWGESYFADANKMIFNGPFTVSEWKHNASFKLTKNQTYWNKDKIWLNEIKMPYLMRDRNSEFNMFKDKKFAVMRMIGKEQMMDAQKQKMEIRKYSSGTVWYFQFNTTRKITGNKNFRKALQFAMDRNEFVKQVYGIPGTKPAYGIIPDYMPGVNKTFGDEYSVAFEDANLKLAKEYLAKAKQELGIDKFPKLTVLASEIDTVRRDMAYFQSYFKETLGLELELDFQSFKVRLERTDNKDFDIVNSGWGPDYFDAMTFADLFTSWNKNNSTGWSSKDYDKHIDQAMNSVDAKVRLDHMHAANQILVEESPILPIYQAANVYVQNPDLIGVIRRAVSPDPDFYYARIKEPTVATKK